MERESFDLELGPGLIEGPIESEQQCIFVRPTWSREAVELVVADAGFRSERTIFQRPAKFVPANEIATSVERGCAYVAGASGIVRFDLAGADPRLLAAPPELPQMTAEEAHEVYGEVRPDVLVKQERAMFVWGLDFDEGSSRLFAHAMRTGALPHLVEIDAEAGGIVSMVPLRGYTAGIKIRARHGVVALPMARHGPALLDLRGQRLGQLPAVQASVVYEDAAIRPADGAVVLAGDRPGLVLWDWRSGEMRVLTDDGVAPSCASNGSIYFMRTCAELWRVDEGSAPRLIARARGNDGGTPFQRRRAWAIPPVLSKGGRFVFAYLTEVKDSGTTHGAIVFDSLAGRVQQRPGFFPQTGFAWV